MRGLTSVAELCREAHISRKTGFKWLDRFRTLGGPGLRDRSRRPKHSPQRTSARWLKASTRLRRKHSPWGGKKILYFLKRGQPTKATFKELCVAVAPKEFDLHINLNLGRSSALMYAADLTEEYVEFNKGDVSDPATLGG